MKGLKRIMGKLIGKTTNKITKEAQAKKVYASFNSEQKEMLQILFGKIVTEDVKNFYSTKIYKTLCDGANKNQKALIAYLCKQISKEKLFENIGDDLKLTKE